MGRKNSERDKTEHDDHGTGAHEDHHGDDDHRGHELAEHLSEIGMCNSHISLASARYKSGMSVAHMCAIRRRASAASPAGTGRGR